MTIEDLEKELKQNNLNNVYLLYGEELFLLETCLKKIKNIFGELIKGINYIEIDDTNIANLISDIKTPAFGYDKKLIIVKNTGIFKRETKKRGAEFANIKERIVDYFENFDKQIENNIVLVFIEESIDKGKLLNVFEENKWTVCNFEYQKPINIIKRLKPIVKAYGVEITDDILKYFIECVGTNMRRNN